MQAAPSRASEHAAKRPRLGVHVSVGGGLHQAFEAAAALGCDCMQVFVKNQRQWKAPPLTDEAVAKWREAARRTQVRPVVAHATYLINLASPDESVWNKSIEALAVELRRCGALGVPGLVVHPGAHLGSGENTGCQRVAAALRRVLEQTADLDAGVWLEITAGQGTNLGHRFEHLRDIVAAAGNAARLGACFDTCHALAAGYGLDSNESYRDTFDAFDRVIGLDRLRCLHLNDSLREGGSRVDRHTHIGKGHVGRGAFQRLVNDPRLRRLPMILETPKGSDPRGRDYDKVNLAALRRLVRSSGG